MTQEDGRTEKCEKLLEMFYRWHERQGATPFDRCESLSITIFAEWLDGRYDLAKLKRLRPSQITAPE